MNVANPLSGGLFTAALSSLNAANKQPQLALDLIVKSIAGLQAAAAAQSQAAGAVGRQAPVTAAADVGGFLINITA